eukprot:gene10611-10681_t
MTWKALESAEQIDSIKHDNGFEMDWDKLPENLPLYFLDLIKYRELSNKIAGDFHVHHESPQLLLIKNGECILDLSHGEVSVDEAMSLLS